MKEYIERSDLIGAIQCFKSMMNTGYPKMHMTTKDIMRIIEEMPAADVVERKRGRWSEPYLIGFDDIKGRDCSECDYTIGEIPLNFCPNCGANMKED